MTVSEFVRQQVRERAGNRCEYCLCHQDYVFGRLQVEDLYFTFVWHKGDAYNVLFEDYH